MAVKSEYSKLTDETANEKSSLLEELSQKLANNIENGLARGTLKKGLDVAPKDYRGRTIQDFEAAMMADLRRAKTFGKPDEYQEE